MWRDIISNVEGYLTIMWKHINRMVEKYEKKCRGITTEKIRSLFSASKVFIFSSVIKSLLKFNAFCLHVLTRNRMHHSVSAGTQSQFHMTSSAPNSHSASPPIKPSVSCV